MKLFLSRILLISLLSANSGQAEEDVKFLQQGSPAPYAGYLFTPNKAEQVRKELIERDGYKLINESLEKSLELTRKNIDLSDLKITNLMEQNNKLSASLYDARETTNWERFFYFALGVAATTLAVYGIKTTLQH